MKESNGEYNSNNKQGESSGFQIVLASLLYSKKFTLFEIQIDIKPNISRRDIMEYGYKPDLKRRKLLRELYY